MTLRAGEEGIDRSLEDDTRVACDEDCGALVHPQTTEEVWAAWEHWMSHSRLHGCAHGC